MNKIFQKVLMVFAFGLLITGCRKKAFDEYYSRPETLAAPIYQQLAAKGKFTNFIACIDKSGYKGILSAAGYWTIFAPNDSAFQKFFAERGITNIAQVDSGTAAKIVTYSLVYNAFLKNRLGDYQSTTGWVVNNAFKRRTANYKGFYKDTTITSVPVTALASNRNNTNGSNYFILGDNNNKYLPYFVDNYVAGKGLSAYDYNYFYPTTTYTGFNIADAKVVTPDVPAENGYINEVDKVLLPLPNIDEYLASKPEYSEFKKLFDKYMVNFVLNAGATDRYNILTGKSDKVYIKAFNNLLAFSPNNENYLKFQDNDGQSEGYSIFVPKNDVLLPYINTVLLEKYPSLDVMPLQIIIDFLNAHMWQRTVWPSKFATTNNFQGEPARFNANADVTDKKVLSNGIFYGTSKVQLANVFSTVYGRAYLDPAYLLMTRALDADLRFTITNPSFRFTVIMMSDALLRSKGFDYNFNQSAWQYTVNGVTTIGNAARDRLYRILATHIIPTPNDELANLSGSGIIESINGEYVKWNAGKLISAGMSDFNRVVTPASTKLSNNGRVYYADSLLTFSDTIIGRHLVKLALATGSQYSEFYKFLINSPSFNAATGDIAGISPGVFYTLFVPNNAAIQRAVNEGWLPGTGAGAVKVPDYNPSRLGARDSVTRFIQYHFLNKTTVVSDGKKPGTFESVLKSATGDPTFLNISGGMGSLSITDQFSRVANVIVASSNNLSNRCVIHLTDNYLRYQY